MTTMSCKSFALFVCVATLSPALGAAQAPAKKPAPKPAAKAPAATAAPKAAPAAAEAPAAPLEDVKKTAQAFTDAFNKHDAKAVAALWTEDGEYIDATGQRFDGRAAIEKQYEAFFAAAPNSTIVVEVDAVRPAGAAAAIEDGRSMLTIDGKTTVSAARYTAVHAKVGDQWLMSSVRDGAAIATPAASHLQDLDWLVGTWSSEKNGGRVDVECKWVADQKFLERRFSASRDGKVVSSGLQVIGWNAAAQSIESWTFTSDGGHAVGLWTPRKGGWVIENVGQLADGTPTTAVNFFVRVDDNSLSWKSVARSAGASPLPDSDEILLKRAVAQK